MTNKTLLDAINNLYNNREQYITAMANGQLTDPITTIIDLIKQNS